MNYELAKELKDANFPWSGTYGYDFAPTLSELIEACGAFNLLLLSPSNTLMKNLLEETPFGIVKKDGVANEEWWAFKLDRTDEDGSGYGESAEEAVARLWLALSKKQV